ncbi:ATP-binding protein [Amycolatopsis sp. NPDC003731]
MLDIEGFGSRVRTNPHQRATRDGLYNIIKRGFEAANISWADCYHEDRGDALFILAPADIDKTTFVDRLPFFIVSQIRIHNDTHIAPQRIRLRMSIHAGEVQYDDHGVTSSSLTLAFRLNAAIPLKDALASSPGLLAMIVSEWFYEDVVRHCPGAAPATYRPVQVEVKEINTIGWITLPDHPYPLRKPADTTSSYGTQHFAPPLNRTYTSSNPNVLAPDTERPRSHTPVPRQLPPPPTHFVGRIQELELLTNALNDSVDAGSTVLISPLAGTGGIGKTWLALYWAHQVVDRFPDGQLFVDLRGFSPDSNPMSPWTALRGFLDALGVGPDQLPADPHAQAALYRSLTAERRILILLDNAANSTQISPLLPGRGPSTVVVTSRRTLNTLISRHGARHLHLSALPPAEAHALLEDWLGSDRVDAEARSVDEIISHCNGLALALGLIAGRAYSHPQIALTQIAIELRDIGLQALDDDDPTASLPAVLSWSYDALTPEQKSVFSLLGVAPGPDISLPAVAQLTNLDILQARRILLSLEESSLLDRDSYGRFSMHDLIRSYAASTAHRSIQKDTRTAAILRVIDFYLHTAFEADRRLRPHRRPIVLDPPLNEKSFPISTYQEALTWYDAEYFNLLAAIDYAATHESKRHAWQIAWTMTNFFRVRGLWQNWAETHSAMIRLAAHEVQPTILARLRHDLAWAYSHLGQWSDAISECMIALELFKGGRDDYGHALCLGLFGAIYTRREEYEIALGYYRESLSVNTDSNDMLQAHALLGIGRIFGKTGRFEAATEYCNKAIAAYQKAGNRNDEARSRDALGEVLAASGNHDDAVACYEGAFKLFTESGELFGQAETLHHLAKSLESIGKLEQARSSWQKAFAIVDALRHPLREEIQIRLAAHHPSGAASDTPDFED